MAAKSFVDLEGLQYYHTKLKNWLANPTHSYTTAANAAKNWFRIANATTSQIDVTKPLHLQFMLTGYNTEVNNPDYYQRWFVDCEVFGRNSGLRIMGNTNIPFSQIRVLYENTSASVTTSTRPAIDVYLNYVVASACHLEIEEIRNDGFEFLANGVLAASTVPTGYESRAVSAYGSGFNNSGYADYATYAALQRSNITANCTLADNTTYRMRVLNCTNAITITVPSTNSANAWFLIKNRNAAGSGKNITLHPSTTSVLFDGVNGNVILEPGEYIMLANQTTNNYSILMDGRKSSFQEVVVTSTQPTTSTPGSMFFVIDS